MNLLTCNTGPYIRRGPLNIKLYHLHELPDKVKNKAMISFITGNIRCVRYNIKEAKEILKEKGIIEVMYYRSNIKKCRNNNKYYFAYYSIRELYNDLRFCDKLRYLDTTDLTNIIESNASEFTLDGVYVTYTDKFYKEIIKSRMEHNILNANVWVSEYKSEVNLERQYYIRDYINADKLREEIECDFRLPIERLKLIYDCIPKEYLKEGFISDELWEYQTFYG